MNIAKAKKHLDQYPDDMACALVLWLPEDVKQVAREQGISKPDEELCGSVLDYVENHHDANYGINWDTIYAALQPSLPEGE